MDGDAGGWLWLVVDVVLVAILAGGMIYATMMWQTRRRNRVIQRAREEATARLFERPDPSERKDAA